MLLAQRLQRVGVGRVARLRALADRQTQVLEKYFRQLLRRAEIELLAGDLFHLRLDLRHLRAQLDLHLLQIRDVDGHALRLHIRKDARQRQLDLVEEVIDAEIAHLGLSRGLRLTIASARRAENSAASSMGTSAGLRALRPVPSSCSVLISVMSRNSRARSSSRGSREPAPRRYAARNVLKTHSRLPPPSARRASSVSFASWPLMAMSARTLATASIASCLAT